MSETYCRMPAKQVLEVCELVVKHFQKSQDFMLRDAADELIKQREAWRRWLPWLKPLTRGEAMKLANDDQHHRFIVILRILPVQRQAERLAYFAKQAIQHAIGAEIQVPMSEWLPIACAFESIPAEQ